MTLANFVKTLVGGNRDDSLGQPRFDAWDAWLQPLAGDSGVGRDPGYEDAFFELRDETQKLSGIDDGLIVRSCEQLMKETGKDLRLAGYFAFARLRQDGPAGFADALELAAALVDRFGEAVLPVRAEAKKGAIEMLATARMLDLLDSRGAFAPADLERALAALDVLSAGTAAWSEAARPNLQPLVSRFEHNDESSRNTASEPLTSSTATPHHVSSSTIASTRDLLDQARRMAVWLRDQDNGYLPSVRLVRSIRWDTLHEVPPADVASRTRLVPPRSELRQQMKRLVLQKQWHELLERVEGAFMEGVNHLWFDLQYFQHIALDHVGAPYNTWRELLRADFALFLERLPGIERLAFNDGTPFADDTTLEWIARHAVVRDLEAGEAVAPLPVSAGGEGDAACDWPEIEAQARELAARDGIEAAFGWLEVLPGMRTDRHLYLQRLVMARLADHADRPDTALALLAELDGASRSLPLMRWEPALVFEVKHQLVRALKATINRKDADKPALARRIGELQAEMTVLDPARALTLS
ncbi:type VI secretion protein [Burkholderia stagnalis]|uniref:type VI secretion system protein TssA n=1 Tax=Burkholderia stagnalis TaxID=1503054 RepID=UPI00075FE03A|nr:type VI secretion system protein TssA [Burkholderia stagnalis]KWK47909.1 type VI secretion protein [Burkholderia stagnalis]KWK66769.1 type VI secretion protein [Burkholderia stagnalis]KWN73493.1 type VI secretion protein [Burkholderia stagnalis]